MKNSALIMLASGLSSRFGRDNKLLANLRGKPLCTYGAVLGQDMSKIWKLAIVAESDHAVAEIFRENNWSILKNSRPQRGLSSSLKIGIQRAYELEADYAVICLADMPLISSEHMSHVRSLMIENDAVMSLSDGALMPPAGFSSHLFDDLLELDGDKGAKAIFQNAKRRATVAISSLTATDIDTPEELVHLNARANSHA